MIYRNGDVSLIRAGLPKGLSEEYVGKEFTFAFGESTGHNHTAVSDRPFQVLNKDGVRYFRFDYPVRLTHPEHREIVVSPGTYRQSQEREVDLFSQVTRKVVD